MISHLFPAAARATLAAGMLAMTLGGAAPSFASGLPDLTATVAVSDAAIPLGDSVDLTLTLKNIGAVATGNAHLHTDITGAQSLSILKQPTGQSSTCSIVGAAVNCPGMVLGVNDSAVAVVRATASSTTTGTISVTARADHNDLVDESNESNNIDVANVSVFRLADLKGTITSGPTVVSGGAHVQFKLKIDNLGGSVSNIGLRFGDTNGLVYDTISFEDGVSRGFSCDLHNPALDNNYVTCSSGSLGDTRVAPAGDESVTVIVGAKVKDRGLTSKDRTVTLTVDQNHNIAESNEGNNTDTFDFHYD